MLKSLSLALYQSPAGDTSPSFLHARQVKSQKDAESLIEEAGNVLNDKIHNVIRKYKDQSLDLTAFNFEKSIESIDPLLWRFVCLCTRSGRERVGQTQSDNHHLKKVRRYFIICMMMFATKNLYAIQYSIIW